MLQNRYLSPKSGSGASSSSLASSSITYEVLTGSLTGPLRDGDYNRRAILQLNELLECMKSSPRRDLIEASLAICQESLLQLRRGQSPKDLEVLVNQLLVYSNSIKLWLDYVQRKTRTERPGETSGVSNSTPETDLMLGLSHVWGNQANMPFSSLQMLVLYADRLSPEQRSKHLDNLEAGVKELQNMYALLQKVSAGRGTDEDLSFFLLSTYLQAQKQ